MLKQALTVVDEERLKSSLDLKYLRQTFSSGVRAALCAEVQEEVKQDRLSRSAAAHFVHVNEDRQREILRLIDQAGDATSAFVRVQILRTQPEQRMQRSQRGTPWSKAVEVRKKVAERLSEAERHADFYQGVYRQYARDLTVLAIYARDLMSHKDISELIARRFPNDAKLFRDIARHTEESEKG
jgi:hypothetical protein